MRPVRPSLARASRDAGLALAFLALAGLPACSKVQSLILGKSDAGSGTSFLGKLAGNFEGEVAMQITMKDAASGVPSEIVVALKKSKFRIDIAKAAAKAPGAMPAEGTLLVDAEQKKAWALVPATQMAMVIDLTAVNPPDGTPTAGPRTIPAHLPSEPPVIEKTGVVDVIAGYSCDVWNVKSQGNRAELCVADDIPWLDLGSLGWSSPQLAVAAMASGVNRFPLRAVLFDAKGTEVTRMQATRIEKKSLEDARFTVPPDYRLVDMQSMLGGLGAGGLPGQLPGQAGQGTMPRHPKAPGSKRK